MKLLAKNVLSPRNNSLISIKNSVLSGSSPKPITNTAVKQNYTTQAV